VTSSDRSIGQSVNRFSTTSLHDPDWLSRRNALNFQSLSTIKRY